MRITTKEQVREYYGKDDTLFAKCDGHLVFTQGVKRRIHVRPLEAEQAEA